MKITDTGWFLLDNVLAQKIEMELMHKNPRALRCDHESLEVLARETGYTEVLYSDARLFGLVIESDWHPNFDVIE